MAIQAMTVASQRVQIALAQLQIQEGAVARASQRLDTEHSRCSSVIENQQRISADIGRIQSALDSGTLPENQSKDLQSQLSHLRNSLDAQTAEVQSCQTAETEATGQLEDEKRKLTALQDRIELLDNALEKISTAR